MIRYGPAASPRWFDGDLDRFPAYLDVLKAAGARQIEFVLLPGPGSPELGRVHLLESQWASAFERARSAGMHIDLHWPLPAEYRLIEWILAPDQYMAGVEPILSAAHGIGAAQPNPPALVLHAAADDKEATRRFLNALLERVAQAGARIRPVVELRAPSGLDDQRFDRSLDSLIRVLEPLGSDAVGICWDIAHDWEADGLVTEVDPAHIRWIRHVHLHDNRTDGHVHAPLGTGTIPWEDAIERLRALRYSGSVTLEIRYRYATDHGAPWSVLDDSLRRVRAVLEGEQLESYAHR